MNSLPSGPSNSPPSTSSTWQSFTSESADYDYLVDESYKGASDLTPGEWVPQHTTPMTWSSETDSDTLAGSLHPPTDAHNAPQTVNDYSQFQPMSIDATYATDGQDDTTPVMMTNTFHYTPTAYPQPPMVHPSQITRSASSISFQPAYSPIMQTYPMYHTHPPLPSSSTVPYALPPSPYHPIPGYYGPVPPSFAPSPINMPSFALGTPYSPDYPYPLPGVALYGSRNSSPESVIPGTASTLARTSSTSSDLRPRPKTKLTFDQKRQIAITMSAPNHNQRQEDMAKMYGVDRSTISKIMSKKEQYLANANAPIPAPVVRPDRDIGGRFPGVEEKLNAWLDEQIAAKHAIKDPTLRDQAKAFALQLGLSNDRFKASIKWLDKFKERRRAAGKPDATTPLNGPLTAVGYPYQPFPAMAALPVPNMGFGSANLTRTHSAVTIASSDSSNVSSLAPAALGLAIQTGLTSTRSETDLSQISPHHTRQRSQSSPQGTPSAKLARTNRPSPLTLTRQGSYHGGSPSPRRPAPLSRANSAQNASSLRSRPRSGPDPVGQSVFGGALSPLTSIPPDYSPTSTMYTHSRNRSSIGSSQVASQLSSMNISPYPSDSESGRNHPLTPLSPIYGSNNGTVYTVHQPVTILQADEFVPEGTYSTSHSSAVPQSDEYLPEGSFEHFVPVQEYTGLQPAYQYHADQAQ